MTKKVVFRSLKVCLSALGFFYFSFVGATESLFGQYSEQEFRVYFEKRIAHLAPYEGMFRVSLKVHQNVQTTTCFFNGYSDDKFDLVAIFRKDNLYQVYSIKNQRNLGYITDDNGRLRFNSLGSVNYPPASAQVFPSSVQNYYFNGYEVNATNFTLFMFGFSYSDIFNYMELSIAKRVKLECYSDDDVTRYLGSTVDVTANAYKVYPNKNEEPSTNSISSGTGVIVSPNGYLLTNYHVIEQTPKMTWDARRCTWSNLIQIRLRQMQGSQLAHCKNNIYCEYENQKIRLVPVYVHKESDIALLKLENVNVTENYTVIDTLKGSLGTEVYTLGFPFAEVYGNDVKYTNGYISSNQKYDSYGLNMGVNPGNSGGGLFSKANGHLIGLTTSRLSEAALGTSVESIAFAMRLNEVARYVKQGSENFISSYSSPPDIRLVDPAPKILIKDSKYNPNISSERNIKSTVLIIASD